MRKTAKKLTELTDAERALVDSVPPPDRYPNKPDADAIKALKDLSKQQQLKVLQSLGITPDNPLSISGDFRRLLLDVIATVGFKADPMGKGKNPAQVSIPTGGKAKK